jgi:hypothetical protein
MFLSSLMAIAAVLIMGVISPGPSFIYVARNAVARSRMHWSPRWEPARGRPSFRLWRCWGCKSADGGAGNVYWPEGRGRPLSALAGV